MGLPAVGLGLGAVGTLFSAIGAGQSAAATSADAAYRAQVARNNQIIAEQNASSATQAGEARATTESLKGAAQLGRIKVGQAANNIDVNTGSAVDVQTSQRELSKLDTATTLRNAQLEAYGYKAQGTGYGAEAELAKAEAGQARAAGGIGVASSLIGGAGTLANRFYWMQQNEGGPGGGSTDSLFGGVV